MTDNKNSTGYTEAQIRVFNQLPYDQRKAWLENNPPGADVEIIEDEAPMFMAVSLGDLLGQLVSGLIEQESIIDREERQADEAYDLLVEAMPDVLMEGNLRKIFHAGFHAGQRWPA